MCFHHSYLTTHPHCLLTLPFCSQHHPKFYNKSLSPPSPPTHCIPPHPLPRPSPPLPFLPPAAAAHVTGPLPAWLPRPVGRTQCPSGQTPHAQHSSAEYGAQSAPSSLKSSRSASLDMEVQEQEHCTQPKVCHIRHTHTHTHTQHTHVSIVQHKILLYVAWPLWLVRTFVLFQQ